MAKCLRIDKISKEEKSFYDEHGVVGCYEKKDRPCWEEEPAVRWYRRFVAVEFTCYCSRQ